MAFLETCFVTGMVVPSGMAAAFATALAMQGGTSLVPVAAAAVGGGFVGDVTGYWIGRRGGQALREGSGMASRALARHDATTGRFLSGHPFFAVTVARLVAFVRTVMPVASGVAGLRFRTFLIYEIPGLIGWAALYMVIGLVAGESWERASSIVGGGWAVIFGVVGLVMWIRTRRRRAEARRRVDSDRIEPARPAADRASAPRMSPRGEVE